MADQQPMTYQEAARMAILCQDACNLSAVIHTFSRSMSAIWQEADRLGKGTDWVNKHPIAAVFTSKIKLLAGDSEDLKNWDKVEKIIRGEKVQID